MAEMESLRQELAAKTEELKVKQEQIDNLQVRPRLFHVHFGSCIISIGMCSLLSGPKTAVHPIMKIELT
jgi:hypothetical protein